MSFASPTLGDSLNNFLSIHEKDDNFPLLKIPVSVNAAYGDPILPHQIEDTCRKLFSLNDQKVPVGFCTKAVFTHKSLNIFKNYSRGNNVVVRYSLTHLEEGGFSFKKRIDTIEKLCMVIGEENVIISPRPIIPGQNDKKRLLLEIIEVAKDYGKKLIIGGLHNRYKEKTLDKRVEGFLINHSIKRGIKYFYKSSCACAYVKKTRCWMHDLGEPKNLQYLDFFGYPYTIHDKMILLEEATIGDLNFLRIITESYVKTRKLINNYNILSLSSNDVKFECTSSWYHWARNLSSCLGCDYCIINNIEYLEKNKKKIGIHPNAIVGFTLNHKRKKVNNYKKGEFNKKRDLNITDQSSFGYESVRIPKPCRSHSY